MSRKLLLFLVALLVTAGWPKLARAQSLVQDALVSFPAETIRLEYSRPEMLRALPDYSSLRQRYVGPRLRELETSLGQLGIEEQEIDELALGWQPSGSSMELYGLTAGRFDLQKIAQSAQARGIAPEQVGGFPAYCVGAGLSTVCALILSPTRGAFGTLENLSEIMDVRHSARPGLSSIPHFARLVSEAPKQAPIWGVAVGPAVTDWFKGWMPGQGSIQLDWTQVFRQVSALSYSVQAGDNVQLGLRLECESDAAAVSLRQVLEGLKLAQQLAWQNQNPSQSNPFQTMQIEKSGQDIEVQLSASYSALGQLGAVGVPAP